MPETTSLEPDLSRPWRVLLTPDNAPLVAVFIEGMLSGRTYTTIRAYEYQAWEPVVETGQRLEKVKATRHSDGSAFIIVADTSGAWGPTAYLDPADQIRLNLDPCNGVIRYRWTTPEGRGCWVHIAVEQHDEELRAEVEQLRAKDEKYHVELRDKRTDLLDIRGILKPADRPNVVIVPMELGEKVAPAVEYLAEEIEQLRAFRADVGKSIRSVVSGELNPDEALAEIGRLLEESGGES